MRLYSVPGLARGFLLEQPRTGHPTLFLSKLGHWSVHVEGARVFESFDAARLALGDRYGEIAKNWPLADRHF